MIERARENEPPRTALSTRELRRKRALRLAIRFALGVGMPTVLAVVYYAGMAAPQYESEAIIAVEANADPFAVSTAKGGSKDVKLVRELIHSRMLVDLLAREGLAEHYRSAGDVLTRLGQDASGDALHAYFQKRLTVIHDPQTNTLAVKVRAFSAEKAQTFARAIVAAAEAKVREISEEGQKRVLAAPEARLAQARAHPEAERELRAAEDALDRAREESSRHGAFLVTIAPPSLPTDPAYPRRAWGIATVFVTSLALVAVLSLLGAAVREHAQF